MSPKVAKPAPKHPPVKSVKHPTNLKWAHRRLHFGPHMAEMQTGPDVRHLQHAVNGLLKHYGIPGHLKVDGECGRHTIAKGRAVAVALGIRLRHPGLTVYAQHLIRHPKQRTPAQRKRSHQWRAAHKTYEVVINGNTVRGGTSVRGKIVAAAMEAAHLYYTGQSHRFYSQPGRWTVDHGITGEPVGYRSDCSQFVTSMFHSAGAPDPNGTDYTGGYTGTLEQHCREIGRAQLKPGDLILYGGPGRTHHVELYVGPGNRTVGHGSPPVDYGDIYMLAGSRFFRAPGID